MFKPTMEEGRLQSLIKPTGTSAPKSSKQSPPSTPHSPSAPNSPGARMKVTAACSGEFLDLGQNRSRRP